MKIFVTGSSGYFGRPLVDALNANSSVIGFDIVDGKDVLNYSQLKDSMSGCEMVVHAAAIPKPDVSKSFDDYFNLNCIGTMNVVKAAIENKVKRLIFISSTGYYGLERGVSSIKLPLKEEQQTAPAYLKADDFNCRDCDLMYSQSKVICENILAFYGLRKKIQIICLRFPRIGDKEGPYDTRVSMDNAVNGTIKALKLEGTFWFEAFNISDKLETVDISKAKKILGYSPV